jgi:hypothetical protein
MRRGLLQFKSVILITSIALYSLSLAQPRQEYVKIIVAPDHADWTYKVGEKVTFTISVLKSGNPVKKVNLKYEIRPEKMDIIKTDEITLETGKISIEAGTMKTPGFLRCWAYATVDGKKYTGHATAGFDPLNIKPTTTLPDDFSTFWDQAKQEASEIPLDAKMTLLPDRCTESVDVYHVSIQNFKMESRIYGMLAIPKKDGKYPALLKVPGAGVRPYEPAIELAEKGIITFKIGIHGIPVNLDLEV